MKLREQIVIGAPPEAVWPWIADPQQQAEWNPRLVSIDREAEGAVRAGEQYEMLYKLHGRERLTHVRVLECRPPRTVAVEHEITHEEQVRTVIERYDLRTCRQGTRVRQTIDLSRSGIPWVARFFVWLVSKLGKPTDEPFLLRLKRLVETRARAGDA